MSWKWPAWLIHSSCWETDEEPEPSGEMSSLQVQSLWLTAARHDLTVWWLMWSLPRHIAPQETLQCHRCFKRREKDVAARHWVKVFIVSSEDGEFQRTWRDLIGIMRDRGGTNHDRTTSDGSSSINIHKVQQKVKEMIFPIHVRYYIHRLRH